MQDMLREVRMACWNRRGVARGARLHRARGKKRWARRCSPACRRTQALVGIVINSRRHHGRGRGDINLAAQPPPSSSWPACGGGQDHHHGQTGQTPEEKRKEKVLTVSGDVYRPAAIEQLQTVTGGPVPVVSQRAPDQNRATLPWRRWTMRKKHYFDVLLVDTASRLALTTVDAEIKALHAAAPIRWKRCSSSTPCRGQDAANTARAGALPLDRRGADQNSMAIHAAALRCRCAPMTSAPSKFAGVSGKIDGLEVFDAERHAGRMLGMGDIVALVEQV